MLFFRSLSAFIILPSLQRRIVRVERMWIQTSWRYDLRIREISFYSGKVPTKAVGAKPSRHHIFRCIAQQFHLRSLGDEARNPLFSWFSSNTQGGSKPSRPRMDPPSHGHTFHPDSSRCPLTELFPGRFIWRAVSTAGAPMTSPGNALLTTMA